MLGFPTRQEAQGEMLTVLVVDCAKIDDIVGSKRVDEGRNSWSLPAIKKKARITP